MKKSYYTLALLSSLSPSHLWGARQAILPETGEPEGTRPNVVLILADDLGWGDLSCYGGREQTPHVDSLARRGIRFTNAHAVASTSTPSRYGMLTGCYPFRRQGTDVAAGNAGMIIQPEQLTVADVFHEAGYRTAAIGKWHLGLGSHTAEQDWNGELDETPRDLGFDYHYIMAATADRVPCVFVEQGRVANWDGEAPIAVSYRDSFPGEPLGRSHPELLTKQRASHGHDMAIVNGIGRIGYMKGGGRALWRDEDIADSLLAHAIRFIGTCTHSTGTHTTGTHSTGTHSTGTHTAGTRTQENGKRPERQPFFLYFATNDVHVPRQPHERFRGTSTMGLRGEAIRQFDWTVGQLMAALDSLGELDNTLFILTSDNGPVLDDGYADRAEELVGDHRPGGSFRGGKYSAFEAGSSVPFIVAAPEDKEKIKEKKEKISDRQVSQIDLLASMAALTGVTLPANDSTQTFSGPASSWPAAPDSRNCLATWLGDLDSAPSTQGISMSEAKLLPSGEAGEGLPFFHVTMAANRSLTVRTQRWKYIEPSNGGPMITWGPRIETGYLSEPQLYDLVSDGGEKRNVAAENPTVVSRMRAIVDSLRK